MDNHNHNNNSRSHEHSHEHNHTDCQSHNNHNNKNNNQSHTSLDNVQRRLRTATLLCFVFILVEVVGGIWSGSLAVLSDAAHLVADLAALGVATAAHVLAQQAGTPEFTYGLKRIESLAALLSMVTLAAVSVTLAFHACVRLYQYSSSSIASSSSTTDHNNNDAIDAPLMTAVACTGVCVNVALAIVLGGHHVHLPGGHDHHHHHHDDECAHSTHDHNHHHHHEHSSVVVVNETSPLVVDNGPTTPNTPDPSQRRRNINLDAAYLHVLGDLAQSVAVLVAGIVIWIRPTWYVIDPLLTLAFCALVFGSTIGVIRRSVAVLLQQVPVNVDWVSVNRALQAVPGVAAVHDLHIWSIADGVTGLTVHVLSSNTYSSSAGENGTHNDLLAALHTVCAQQFGIHHTTIQIQTVVNDNLTEAADDCVTCGPVDAGDCCPSSEERC